MTGPVTDPPGPDAPGGSSAGVPLYAVTLWPHRSLSTKGFHAFLKMLGGCILVFILVIAAAPGVPYLPGGGRVLLLATVPFFALAFLMVWLAFRRNYRDGRLTERLTLFSDRLLVERIPARGRPSVWEAAPHWVSVTLHNDRTAQSRLLLLVSGKGVELGSFLNPEERRALAAELERVLTDHRSGRLQPQH